MATDCQYIRALAQERHPPQSLQARIIAAHLTQCAECRLALGSQANTLLQNLLSPPAASTRDTLLVRLLRQRRSHRPRIAHWRWPHYLIACTLAACIGFLVADVISAIWATQRIYDNLGTISVVATTPTLIPNTATAEPTPEPPTPTPATFTLQPMTILLLGSDRRPQEQATSRTDAIMLMRIDPQQQRVSLLSLPRDLVVNIPGYGWSRINAAHVYGDIYPALGGGLQLATQTVSQVIGMPIDYTVVIDFAGFIDVINTLDGVPVNVTQPLYDDRFPTMDYQYTTVSFTVGENTMDGLTALTYSRIRHPDSDFARMQRQQYVITGIAKRLQSGDFLQTLETTADLTDALVPHARTTLPRDTIIQLAWMMRTMPLTNISYHVFSDVYYGSGEDRYAMYPNAGAIPRIVQEWLGQS